MILSDLDGKPLSIFLPRLLLPLLLGKLLLWSLISDITVTEIFSCFLAEDFESRLLFLFLFAPPLLFRFGVVLWTDWLAFLFLGDFKKPFGLHAHTCFSSRLNSRDYKFFSYYYYYYYFSTRHDYQKIEIRLKTLKIELTLR